MLIYIFFSVFLFIGVYGPLSLFHYAELGMEQVRVPVYRSSIVNLVISRPLLRCSLTENKKCQLIQRAWSLLVTLITLIGMNFKCRL